MTDFENAAFSIFIVLLSRVILSFDLNFYIPIPRTTENMETAHKHEAVLNDKFWFRKDPFPGKDKTPTPNPESATGEPRTNGDTAGKAEDEYTLLTINEIINGTGSQDGETTFPGLIPLVQHYLSSLNVNVTTRCQLERYLDLISRRASGTLWTNSKWIRHFVREHPDYKKDSAVSEKVTYDLIKTVVDEIEPREDWSRREGPGWQMFRTG